ncbi:MAG: FCD domain-containing protein, partial [Actinomycetota bacterium]|nr:FCD domain-containing protein [Actinomycetota bacterium]
MTATARRNLGQAVSEDLLALVRSGELRPGERIPTERGLMEMFGVGRNTIREAVQVLASRGILDVRPGRGTTVRGVETDEVIDRATLSALLSDRAVGDLYDFRRLVEVEAAALAAERATDEQLAVVERRWSELEHALRGRLPTWEQDVSFHRAVVEASGNAVLTVVLDAVRDRLVAVRKETQQVERAVSVARTHHRAILEAIRARDPAAARAVMAEHVEAAAWAAREARRHAR